MKRLVVDASVAVKWVLPEDDSDLAVDLLLHREAVLHAPAFLVMEAGNVFWSNARRGRLRHDQALEWLTRLRRAPLLTWDGEEPLPEAMTLAQRLDHAVYDCAYLALAIHLDGLYVTADRRFWNKAERDDDLRGRVVMLEEWADRL